MADLTDARPRPILLSDSVDVTSDYSPGGGLPEELHHTQGRVGARKLDLTTFRGLSRADHLQVTDELLQLAAPEVVIKPG